MADKSTIEWTEATWNPVTGCSKVSPGCAHCYAETLAKRLHAMGQRGYTDLPWTPENAAQNVTPHPERLDQPLRWKRPRMIFVNSMSDLFHEDVADEFIDRIFAVMAWATQHTFQVLTKRPERMRAYLTAPDIEHRLDEAMCNLCCSPAGNGICGTPGEDCGLLGSEWPLPNVWLGVSIENRRYVHRADLLRETPAARRFISAEPLLGPLVPEVRVVDEIDLQRVALDEKGLHAEGRAVTHREWADGFDSPGLDLTDIDWLIVGGESGPGHRPMRPEWARDLRDACIDLRHSYDALGSPRFFFKQWGGATPKAGGRELDGRTWDEMPERREAVVA